MYRLVDHTADLAIEATGASREEVLQDAALGLTQVLTGRRQERKRGLPLREASFTLEAPDLPALAVAFLAELLWLNESEDLLWLGGGVTVHETPEGGWRLVAMANVAVQDVGMHGRGVEVKAVTYHGLRFQRGVDGQWHLWVLLDI